jgi:hypothetical protein
MTEVFGFGQRDPNAIFRIGAISDDIFAVELAPAPEWTALSLDASGKA